MLVGYSYGSLIAASASANIPQRIGCISIAPPWTVQHWLLLFNSNYHLAQSRLRNDIPRLYVIGDQDNFTPETLFRKTVKTIPKSTGAVLKGADHFFARREKDLMTDSWSMAPTDLPTSGREPGQVGQCEIQLAMSEDMTILPSNSSESAVDPYGCDTFLPGVVTNPPNVLS
jgi:dienelactone hydrolase